MSWRHRRDRTKVEAKKEEPRAGTRSSFIAAALVVA
jgi:hypothetical protein